MSTGPSPRRSFFSEVGMIDGLVNFINSRNWGFFKLINFPRKKI